MYARALYTFSMLGLVVSGGTIDAPATSAPNSQHGQELAARLCSNCHLVGNSEQQQTNADVPSFHEIASKDGQSSYGRVKNARDAAAITAVAAQPQIAIDRDSVSRPMTLGLRTINIITAISGAASTPLTTAAQ